MRLLLTFLLFLATSAEAGLLKFKAHQKWTLQVKSKAGTTEKQFEVGEILRDGSAFVLVRDTKVPGVSKELLKSKPAVTHLLTTTGGVYPVGLADMERIRQLPMADQWIREKSMNVGLSYRLPMETLKPGKQTVRQWNPNSTEFSIWRQKNQVAGGRDCAVYQISYPPNPPVEKIWVDLRNGVVMKRQSFSGGKLDSTEIRK
jgi:hypothetical protein